MPHNPIIRRAPLGTSPPDIGATQRGVLFDGRDYWDLPARVSMPERLKWRNYVLSVVECGWRAWKMPGFSLTTADRQPIDWECELSYRVADPKTFVRRQVNDVEVELKRALLSSLAALAARYRLAQHSEMPAQLAQAVRDAAVFRELGLEVDPGVRVAPRLSPAQEKFIADARALDRAARAPRAYGRRGELRTSQPTYVCNVNVDLHVQIADRTLFDSVDDLERAVDSVWAGNVRPALARASRKFTYQDLAKADDALEEVVADGLAEGRFDGYGLRVINVAVEATLGASADSAARQDEEFRRKLETETKLDTHLRSLVFTDKVGAVMLALARGQLDPMKAQAYFDERQLQNYRLSMESLEKFQKLEVLAPDQADAAVRVILSQSMSEATDRPVAGDKEGLSLREMIHLMGGEAPKALTNNAGGQ